MRKYLPLPAVLICVSLLFTVGCDRINEAISAGKGPVDAGTLSDGSYTSDFFNFSLTFPQNWQSIDRQVIRETNEQMFQALTAQDPELQEEARSSMERTHYLLSVYDPGRGGHGFNPNIVCVAEEVRSQRIRTAEAYLEKIKSDTQRLNLPLTFAGESRSGAVGNREFVAQGVQIQAPGVQVRQFWYATLIDGYALFFTLSYTNSAELAELQRALQSITFN